MNYTKKRWLFLIICCIINFCCGVLYSWSVMAGPLAGRLSELNNATYTIGDLAIVYTFTSAVGPVAMIIGGTVNDKKGPKPVFLLSGIMLGLGFILSSMATSITMLMIVFGIFVGFGGSFGYGCAVSTATKYFPDKRGLAGGIATAFYGCSSIVMPVILLAMNGAMGIAKTFLVLGIIYLVVICLTGIFVKKCPPNFRPDGWTPPAVSANTNVVEDKNWLQMIKTPIFYIMLVMLLCGAFAGAMVISQASGIAQNLIKVDMTTASLVVSILAAFNVIGRLVSGSLSDKIGRVNTLTIAFIFAFVGGIFFMICGEGTFALFVAGVACTGIAYGSIMGVFPGFTTDQFGVKNNSVNYAIMFIGFALAGVVSPIITKSVYASTGSYMIAFIFCAALGVLGLLFTFVYRLYVRGQKKKAQAA